MPLYEYYCETCKHEVTLNMSLSAREQGGAACPDCGNRAMRPLLGSVFTQTSRKS